MQHILILLSRSDIMDMLFARLYVYTQPSVMLTMKIEGVTEEWNIYHYDPWVKSRKNIYF